MGFDALILGRLFSVINAGKTRIRYKKCLNFSSGPYRTISPAKSQTYSRRFGIFLIYAHQRTDPK